MYFMAGIRQNPYNVYVPGTDYLQYNVGAPTV